MFELVSLSDAVTTGRLSIRLRRGVGSCATGLRWRSTSLSSVVRKTVGFVFPDDNIVRVVAWVVASCDVCNYVDGRLGGLRSYALQTYRRR